MESIITLQNFNTQLIPLTYTPNVNKNLRWAEGGSSYYECLEKFCLSIGNVTYLLKWEGDYRVILLKYDKLTKTLSTLLLLDYGDDKDTYFNTSRGFFYSKENNLDYLYICPHYNYLLKDIKVNLTTNTKTSASFFNKCILSQQISFSKYLFTNLVQDTKKDIEVYIFTNTNGNFVKSDLYKSTNSLYVAYAGSAFQIDENNYIFIFYNDTNGYNLKILNYNNNSKIITENFSLNENQTMKVFPIFINNDNLDILFGDNYASEITYTLAETNAFNTSSKDFYFNDSINNGELGVGLSAGLTTAITSLIVPYFATDSFDIWLYLSENKYNNWGAPNLMTIYLPYRTIPSINGATYNLDKDVFIDRIKYSKNQNFVCNGQIKMSVFHKTINGTIKIN